MEEFKLKIERLRYPSDMFCSERISSADSWWSVWLFNMSVKILSQPVCGIYKSCKRGNGTFHQQLLPTAQGRHSKPFGNGRMAIWKTKQTGGERGGGGDKWSKPQTQGERNLPLSPSVNLQQYHLPLFSFFFLPPPPTIHSLSLSEPSVQANTSNWRQLKSTAARAVILWLDRSG